MTNNEEQIYEWADRRMFDKLTAQEQELVLAYMTSQDYDEIHKMYADIDESLETDINAAIPKPASLDVLKTAVTKNPQAPVVFLWQKKLPMYWTAAACLLAFLFSYFLLRNPNTPEPITQERTIIEKVYDTLYIEKPVITEVVKQVFVPVQPASNISMQTSFEPDESVYLQDVAPTPSKAGIVKSFGNSGVDSDALEQFKVQM